LSQGHLLWSWGNSSFPQSAHPFSIALIFAAPAALAGYHATYGLSGLTTSSDLVREVFAVIGAIVTGATAWTRLAASPTAVSAGPGRPALS
jgi:hypothetical protein